MKKEFKPRLIWESKNKVWKLVERLEKQRLDLQCNNVVIVEYTSMSNGMGKASWKRDKKVPVYVLDAINDLIMDTLTKEFVPAPEKEKVEMKNVSKLVAGDKIRILITETVGAIKIVKGLDLGKGGWRISFTDGTTYECYNAEFKMIYPEEGSKIEKTIKLNKYPEGKGGIKVEGHKGTWYVLSGKVINGKDLYLLEHEQYGEDAPAICIDFYGSVFLEDIYNGWDDVEYFIETEDEEEEC